jgi:hypothetical protein
MCPLNSGSARPPARIKTDPEITRPATLQFVKHPARIVPIAELTLQDDLMRTVLCGICGLFGMLALASLPALDIQPDSHDSDPVGELSTNELENPAGEDSPAVVDPAGPGAPLIRSPRVRLVTGLASRHSASAIRLGAALELHRPCGSPLSTHSLSVAPTLQSAQIRLQI